MTYFIAFLEGMITFISPCLLPMLPIYLSYFGGNGGKGKTISNALAFILGFTLVFTTMGAFAGQMGSFLMAYQTPLNLVTGGIVILFGLQFMGAIKLPQIQGFRREFQADQLTLGRSVLFGMVFAISWTPCVGVFLGSALMMASQQGSTLAGVYMLFAYAMGLGIPLLLSAVLMDTLIQSFDLLKKNFALINKISGLFLVVVGLAMMSGSLNRLLAVLTV